jgi:hypothetical protein
LQRSLKLRAIDAFSLSADHRENRIKIRTG